MGNSAVTTYSIVVIGIIISSTLIDGVYVTEGSAIIGISVEDIAYVKFHGE